MTKRDAGMLQGPSEPRQDCRSDDRQDPMLQIAGLLNEAVWTCSGDMSKVLYANCAFESIYRHPVQALFDDPGLWRKAVHPADAAQFEHWLAAPDGSPGGPLEYRIVRPDGHVRWISQRVHKLEAQLGSGTSIVCIAEDITVRKELESFCRTLAHHLKGSLNSVLSMGGLLRMKASAKLEVEEQRYLALIERSSREMASAIDDLATLAWASHAELQCTWVDLAPMAHAEIEQLRTLQPLRHVVATIPDPLPIYGDEGLLHAVLRNLLSNAWKFTGECETARIALGLARRQMSSTLTVVDNGVGFDASGLGDVLQPFRRFHAQGRFPGNGLGLVTCQRVIQRHGGSLAVQSRPGAGTEVSITLPNGPQPTASAPRVGVSAGPSRIR